MSDEPLYPSYPVPPYEPPPPKGPSRTVRIVVVAVLVVLMAWFGLSVFLTKDLWAGGPEHAGTTMTIAAKATSGSPPTPDELATARTIVSERVDGLGISGATVTLDGGTLAVTVPGDGDGVRDVTGQGARLYIRPVIHAIPSQSAGTPDASGTPPRDVTGPAEQISDEKQLRQSTEQSIQTQALQFAASRCGEDDVLAGHDDPKLSLVTCSQDGRQVYLLDKSIISGQQIQHAESGFDEQQGQYIIDMQLNSDATKTWADFTADNIGTQTAFTLNTSVVSAPQIMEAIPGGRTIINGQFSADSARELSATLGSGTLPLTLTYESSTPATIAGTAGSTVLRIGLVAGGSVLVVALIGATAYLASSRRRDRPS